MVDSFTMPDGLDRRNSESAGSSSGPDVRDLSRFSMLLFPRKQKGVDAECLKDTLP
jgi:hypothetical protein